METLLPSLPDALLYFIDINSITAAKLFVHRDRTSYWSVSRLRRPGTGIYNEILTGFTSSPNTGRFGLQC